MIIFDCNLVDFTVMDGVVEPIEFIRIYENGTKHAFLDQSILTNIKSDRFDAGQATFAILTSERDGRLLVGFLDSPET